MPDQAGRVLSSSGTVSQSGISKQLDAHTGHKFLTSIAKSLARAERFLAEYALIALRGRSVTAATIAMRSRFYTRPDSS